MPFTEKGTTPAGQMTGVDILPYDAIVFASAARTATPTTQGFAIPVDANSCMIVIDTTASAAPSTVVTIEAYDPAKDGFVPILASAAIVANGTVILRVHPGGATVANLTADSMITRIMRVSCAHGNGNSHTYSVGIHFAQV